MRQRKLDSIAKRWWRSRARFNYYDNVRVERILETRVDLVPRLIRALVDAAPSNRLAYIGTSVLEDIAYSAEHKRKPNRALALVAAARLPREQLVTVLAGVYPELLTNWNVKEVFSGTLSASELAFLTDEHSAERRMYL